MPLRTEQRILDVLATLVDANGSMSREMLVGALVSSGMQEEDAQTLSTDIVGSNESITARALLSYVLAKEEPISMTLARPKRPRRILLVRHGQSEANVDPAVYQRTPDSQIHLTRLGWEQAELAGRALPEYITGRAHTFFSPFVRTRETLRGLAHGLEGTGNLLSGADEEPRIAELDTSGGNLMTQAEFEERSVRSKADPYFYHWPAGESMAVLENRVLSFCNDLLFTGMASIHGADTVVMVSHAFTTLCLLRCLIGGTLDDMMSSKSAKNCEIVVIDWFGDGHNMEVGPAPLQYYAAKRVHAEKDGVSVRANTSDSNAALQWELFKEGASEAKIKKRRLLEPLAYTDKSQANI